MEEDPTPSPPPPKKKKKKKRLRDASLRNLVGLVELLLAFNAPNYQERYELNIIWHKEETALIIGNLAGGAFQPFPSHFNRLQIGGIVSNQLRVLKEQHQSF